MHERERRGSGYHGISDFLAIEEYLFNHIQVLSYDQHLRATLSSDGIRGSSCNRKSRSRRGFDNRVCGTNGAQAHRPDKKRHDQWRR